MVYGWSLILNMWDENFVPVLNAIKLVVASIGGSNVIHGPPSNHPVSTE